MSGVTLTSSGGIMYEYDWVSRYPYFTRDELRRNRALTKKRKGWHLRWTQEALFKLYPERYARKVAMSSMYGKVAAPAPLREYFGPGSLTIKGHSA